MDGINTNRRTSRYNLCNDFFFYRYRNPRDLPSFPTRRSSDLLVRGSVRDLKKADKVRDTLGKAGSDLSRVSRSEEHTSELQSQFHLVCRLLLEKKKNDLTDMI